MKEIVKKLRERKKTIATMESCTGGYLASCITNIPGSSEILKFSAVTYSNEYKIKMGVSSEIIEKYTVYSIETANEMSKNISLFADSDYGVGITGIINDYNNNNVPKDDDVVYISVYEKETDKFYTNIINPTFGEREKNKNYIVNQIEEMLINII